MKAFTQFMTIASQINNLQGVLDSLQIKKKRQLVLQIEREKQESYQRLAHVESQNIELTSKIEDEMRILEEHESTTGKGDILCDSYI